MRKHLVCFVLAVAMLSLLTASAFAEPAVAIHTLNKGETIYSLCSKCGVDYQSYKTLIMALNSIQNEADFAKLPVGSKVALPVSASAAEAISGNRTGTAALPGKSAASTPAASPSPVPGAAGDVVWGDKINCYVISYTVKPGDTFISIYNARGLNYKTYSSLILRLNKLSSLNSLKVGKTLLLPVTTVNTGDEIVYTLMTHVMKSGETVYSVVKNGYGLNYKDNQELLSRINGKDNLGSCKVGEPLHIAVRGYIAPTALTPPSA